MSTQNIKKSINFKNNAKSKPDGTKYNSENFEMPIFNDHDDLNLDDKLIKADKDCSKCCYCSKSLKYLYRTYITAFNYSCGQNNHFHLLCKSCKEKINKK